MNLRQSVFGVITLSAFLLLTSCAGLFNRGTNGSGTVISESIKVESFSEIEIDGVFDVILKQGSKEGVTIETDDNLVELIDVSVSNSKLTVSLKNDAAIGSSTKLNVFITLVDISDLRMHGVGDLSCETPLKLNTLSFENSGVGDINLVLDCTNFTIHNSSVGDIKLSGRTKNLTLNSSGVGDILGFDLKSEHTTVSNSGVGDVEINASESVSIESSGVGDVDYSGQPKAKKINENGVGDIVNV